MRKNVLKVLAVTALILFGIISIGVWEEQKNFEKSLEGMSPESAMIERRLASNTPEEKAAFKLIWGIKTGDILVMLDDGKEEVGIADQGWGGRLTFLAPDTQLWWNTTPSLDSEQVLRFARSFRKVIHIDNPRWCEYARWVYGEPKAKSTE